MEITFEAFQYESYLSETNFNNLQQCIYSYRQDQFFASAVWGAVFLEGFLPELVREIKEDYTSSKDLYDYINVLNQLSKKKLDGKMYVPQEIGKRADEIRLTRNRLVHDTGSSKDTVGIDAYSIANHLKVILEWYKKNFTPKYNDNPLISANPELSNKIPVFISTITPDNEAQKYFLNLFEHKLRKLGVDPVKVVMDEYDSRDPIGKIHEVMEKCEAVIVIGLERSHAYFLRDRVGSSRETDKIHTKYTSGWLHLEAGMANAMNKEVFVLCQSDIYSDGIFDRAWYTYPVIEFQFKNVDVKSISDLFNGTERGIETFFNRIQKWAVTKRDVGRQHS